MSKELEHIQTRLKDIERKSQSLRDQLGNLNQQQRELILRGIELKHGVTVGSVVLYRGIEHKVTRVETRWGIDRPWLEGNPKRKDGSFRTAHRNLFGNWTTVQDDGGRGDSTGGVARIVPHFTELF